MLQEVYLSKTNSVLTGNKVLNAIASNTHGFLLRDAFLFYFQAYFKQKEPLSTLKQLSCSKYSFHKLTEFSKGSNVLGAVASNIDGFLWTDTCVSSTQLNRFIWGEYSLSPPETPKLQEVILSKYNSILTWKQCDRCFCF
jgi:hypothetical protein